MPSDKKEKREYKAKYMYQYKRPSVNPKYSRNDNEEQKQDEGDYGRHGGNYQSQQHISYNSQDQAQSHQQQGQTDWQ